MMRALLRRAKEQPPRGEGADSRRQAEEPRASNEPGTGGTSGDPPRGADGDPVFRIDLTSIEEEPEAGEAAEGPEAHGAGAEEPEPPAGREVESADTIVAVPLEEGAEPGDVGLPGEDRGGPGVDPRTLAELEHPLAEVRKQALARLAREPGAAPVVPVIARLRDPEPRVREQAVAVLEATEDEGALMVLLDSLDDPAEEVRRRVREAFGQRRSDSLVGLLRRELAVAARRRHAATLLAELREVDALVEAAEGADSSVRATIAEAVGETGLTEQLIAELSDARADRRRLAAERLGAMRMRGGVGSLIERLQDPDREVRIKVAEALGRIGDPGATPALKRSLIWDPESSVVIAVGHALRKIARGSVAPAT